MLADQGPPYRSTQTRRRRRVWPYVLIVVVLVIGAALVVADRVAANIAENKIADRLAGERPFTQRPDVTIHGLSFLAQAVRGVYDDVEVSGPGESVGALGSPAIAARLHGVHLSLSDATSHVDRVPVDRIDLGLGFSLGALASASGIRGLTLTAQGDHIVATAVIDLPVVGSIPVTATGRLIVADNTISAELTSIQGVGLQLPAAAEQVARNALTVAVPITGLPFSSVAASAEVHGATVTINAVARDVVLE